jgi:hypothetical protein
MKRRLYTLFLIVLTVTSLSVLGDSAVANVAENRHQAGHLARPGNGEALVVRDKVETAHPSELLARNMVQTEASLGEETSEAAFDDSDGIPREASSSQERPPKGYLALIVFGSLLFGTAVYLRREKSP